MRMYALLPVALVAAAVAPTTLAADPLPAQTSVPPKLQALEQKMLHIRFNTFRFSLRFVMGELSSPAGGELGVGVDKCKSLIGLATAAISLAPQLSTVISRVDGVVTVKERSIGKAVYTYTPSVRGYDGQRPWVRSLQKPTPKSKRNPASDALSATFPEDEAAPTRSTVLFTRLVKEVDGALSVQEVGPATVDGQQTTEYTATVSMARLLAGRLSPKQIEVKKLTNTTIALELFVAPNGMPVRTISIVGTRSEGIGVQEDILATGIPVVVHAPPASMTISEAHLRQLQKRHQKGSGPTEPLSLNGPPNSARSKCPSEGNEEKRGGIFSTEGPARGILLGNDLSFEQRNRAESPK